MNDRIRRALIFIIIVGTGTLLILTDLPLLVILPLILAIGIVLLLIFGAVSISDLKTMFSARLKKGGGKPASPPAAAVKPATKPAPEGTAAGTKRLPFGLNALFKKKPARPTTPAAQPHTPFSFKSLFRKKPAAQKPVGAPRQKAPGSTAKKQGLSLHAGSFIGSLKALGTILTTRKKTDPDKMKKIDTLLDYAVSEKANDTAPASPLQESPLPATGMAGGGGAGAAPVEEDPFLSLSNDELDLGLLDDLDEGVTSAPAPEAGMDMAGLSVPLPEDIENLPLGENDMPVPPQEVSSSVENILNENETGLTDLTSLDGIESVDENLGELDSISLDSMELGDDLDEDDEPVPDTAGTPAPAATAAPAAGAPGAPSPAPSASAEPSGGSKGKSDQSEMAAFAAASGGDDDMLSSLAADIKTVKKEQDISLLRELKDFRAAGTTIETELSDLYTSLNAAADKQKKARPAAVKKPAAK